VSPQILPRFRRHEEREADLEFVAEIIATTGDRPVKKRGKAAKRVGFRSAEDDLQRMRLIPVVAEGVSGTAPGTDPLAELLRREHDRERRRVA